MKRIGVLTGGGDCPGLNAAIRAVVRKSMVHDWAVIGVRNGWQGLVEGSVEPLTEVSVAGILHRGGTILGTSRTNPVKRTEDTQKLLNNMKKYGLEALIAIGGEDTLGVALKLHGMGVPVVGIPKTIDNDLSGTQYTIGFQTAVSIVTEAIDRLHTTAESHHRIMVVEVMGRHAGWIAVCAGIAGGADDILIPERPFEIDEVCNRLRRRFQRDKKFSIVVVAEGATLKGSGVQATQDVPVDAFGHVRLGGIGNALAKEIESRTGWETRVTNLGHIQRGGGPCAYDRVLATRFGVAAVGLVRDGDFGKMVALHGNDIVAVELKTALAEPKTVDKELCDIAQVFLG
jgi:phosphofructokinase-like protein